MEEFQWSIIVTKHAKDGMVRGGRSAIKMKLLAVSTSKASLNETKLLAVSTLKASLMK